MHIPERVLCPLCHLVRLAIYNLLRVVGVELALSVVARVSLVVEWQLLIGEAAVQVRLIGGADGALRDLVVAADLVIERGVIDGVPNVRRRPSGRL